MTREPQVLLERVPQVAVDAMEAAAAFALLLGPDRSSFRIASAAGLSLPELGQASSYPLACTTDTPAGLVLAQGKPVSVPDVAVAAPFDVPPASHATGVRSSLGVPLFDRGRQMGVNELPTT